MIDENADVRRTFNDYQEEESISFVKFHPFSQHPYVGKCLKEITLPPKLLVVVLIRGKRSVSSQWRYLFAGRRSDDRSGRGI